MVEFKCRHCATKYKVREALCGRTAECKTCGRRFVVPYASPVVRLGDEDLSVDEEAVADPNGDTKADEMAADETAANEIAVGEIAAGGPADGMAAAIAAGMVTDTARPAAVIQPPAIEAVNTIEDVAPPAVGSEMQRLFPEYARKKRSTQPIDQPLIPLPAIVSQLWLPLGLAVLCLGLSAYLVLDCVLRSNAQVGGLILIAFGAAALLVIAYRLTLRALEGAAHTFDIRFSDAIALQTIACLSVPVLGGIIGLIEGGVTGTAIGAGLGALLCPLVMTVIYQLPAGKGLQSGVIGAGAFAVGYAGSALLVAAVANVMFTLWSVDLPWKIHVDPNAVAAAAVPAIPPATQPSPAQSAATQLPKPLPTPAVADKPQPLPAAATPPVTPLPPAPSPSVQPDATPMVVPGANSAAAKAPGDVPAAPPAGERVSIPATPAPPAGPTAAELALTALQDAVDDLRVGKSAEASARATALQKNLPKAVGRLTDPAWIDSLHIQAVAAMRLGQPAKAAPALQRVLDSGLANRSIVINHAVCDILGKSNAMRAVKNLKAYAATHPDDEQAVSLWGVALDTFATRQKGVRLEQQADDYVKANALLERTRPGQYHWGTRWITAGEWQGIEQRRASANAQISEANRQLRDANVRLDSAQRAYQRSNVLIMGRQISESERYQIERRKRLASEDVAECRRAVEWAKSNIEQAQSQIPRPTWEMAIQPLDPDLLSH